MTKNEFIKEVARRGKFSNYAVEEMFNVSSNLIVEILINGESVDVPGLGVYKTKSRGETTYKNLFGMKEKTISSVIYPSFSISNTIKTRVKNTYKH